MNGLQHEQVYKKDILENYLICRHEKLSDPNLYLNEPDIFFEITKKLEKSKEDLEYFENRWLELEEIKNF